MRSWTNWWWRKTMKRRWKIILCMKEEVKTQTWEKPSSRSHPNSHLPPKGCVRFPRRNDLYLFTFIYIICINNNKIINSRSYSPTWGNHHFNAKLPPTSSPFLMKNCSSNSPPTVKASKNINLCMKKGRRAPSMKKKSSIQLWIKKPINLDPYPYKK